MIDVWEMQTDDERYISLTCAEEDNTLLYLDLLEPTFKTEWSLPPVYHYLYFEPSRKKLIESDFPGFFTPIFTPKTIPAFMDIIKENGCLIPLECPDGGEFYAFQITTVLDVFDREHAEFYHIPGAERIIVIEKYAFLTEKLARAPIFKIPEQRAATFVTKPFIDRVEEHGFTGLLFEKVT